MVGGFQRRRVEVSANWDHIITTGVQHELAHKFPARHARQVKVRDIWTSKLAYKAAKLVQVYQSTHGDCDVFTIGGLRVVLIDRDMGNWRRNSAERRSCRYGRVGSTLIITVSSDLSFSVVRSKAEAHSTHKPKIIPLPDDDEDGDDSDDSDKKSKMSFSYWGADKITLQKPILKSKQHALGGSSRRVSPGGTSYARESSANAKFGTRLVSGDQVSPAMRSASKRAQAAPSTKTRVNPSDDSHSVKATVTRPAWDTSTRGGNPPTKRPRQTSQPSAATRATLTATNGNNNTKDNKSQASPVASEDSGVGLYRQIVAQDPSLVQ